MAASDDQPIFLTTSEVASLLRVKERKIYALAASNGIPCRRVSGKLLFPRRDIEAWLGVGTDRAGDAAPAPSAPPAVVAGSHDPLLEWAVRASGSGLATMFDGSLDGLDRVAGGEAAACGMHVVEGIGEWNVAHVVGAVGTRPMVLVEWARRSQGLIWSNGAAPSRGIAALKGCRVALRQPRSGGAILFDRLAREADIQPDAFEAAAPVPRPEYEAAAFVARVKADTALGLQSMARAFDLGFEPLAEERYDLLVDRQAWFERPLQTLLAFVRDGAFTAQAEELGGYDLSGHGTVHWNGP